MAKKLTFVLPCYNAEDHLRRNLEMWKQVSKEVELIFVEDDTTTLIKDLVKTIGGQYFNKPNGNWGSVVNFARANNLVKSEYVAVVDPDDEINVEDLKTLIDLLDSGKDLYLTGFTYKNFQTKKTKKKKLGLDKWTFVHQIWFKTEIFYTLPDLPEKVSFMDNIVVKHILEQSTTFEEVRVFPYIYLHNFPGQSTAGGLKNIEKRLEASKMLSSFSNNLNVLNHKLESRYKTVVDTIRFHDLSIIRNSFDNEKDKNNRKQLIKTYKEHKSGLSKKIPIRFWMIWSKLFVILTFK